MLALISNLFCLVTQLPGDAWRAVKDFFGKSLPKWWYSHYR